MEWYFTLALILGALLVCLMVLRLPVFVALLGIGVVVLIGEYGWAAAARQVPLGFASSLSSYSLAPVVMFFLMGEILFRAGIVERAINAITLSLDRVPGKLAASATVTGGVLSIVSGSSTATTALLGKNLVPEMEKRDYKPGLTLGSVMAAGSLAMIIPPSTTAVVLGATASIPVGPLLVAGILPGILMIIGYLLVQFVWVFVFKGDGNERSEVAGADRLSFWHRTKALPGALLPLLVVFAIVLGLIMFGIATPSESAAFGVLASLVVALMQRKLTWKVLWESAKSTAIVSGAILLLIGAAGSFSQALAASGVLPGFLSLFSNMEAASWMIVVLLLLVVIFLGMFLETLSIVMITAPFFVPIISAIGVDPVWFGVLWLIALGLSMVTPPFGMELFVMRRVAPQYSMGTIYKAVFPFILSPVLTMVIVFFFPILATGLTANSQ